MHRNLRSHDELKAAVDLNMKQAHRVSPVSIFFFRLPGKDAPDPPQASQSRWTKVNGTARPLTVPLIGENVLRRDCPTGGTQHCLRAFIVFRSTGAAGESARDHERRAAKQHVTCVALPLIVVTLSRRE